MKAAVMFSKSTDEWATPQDFFDKLNAEFEFDIDAAASAENAKCAVWFGGAVDALALKSWGSRPMSIFLNPPYSKCLDFMAKAREQATNGGHTVVCLVPARTDTRWWHLFVYYGDGMWWPGTDVRFLKGRLKFGNSQNSAPFPSVVVIFRPS